MKSIGIENFQKDILFEANSSEEMFDKERELVEIGSHSYNLKEGGYGGWGYTNKTVSDDQKKRRSVLGRIRTDQILEEKYGKNWRRFLAESSAKKRNQICRERCIGLFNPATREKGRKLANSIESIEKRVKTYQMIHHQQGEKNSQYGTMWITDGIDNRKIKKEEVIPEGWRRGRIVK